MSEAVVPFFEKVPLYKSEIFISYSPYSFFAVSIVSGFNSVGSGTLSKYLSKITFNSTDDRSFPLSSICLTDISICICSFNSSISV